MRLACIDIGTNTTRLLVAEPDGAGLRAIQSWRAFTRADGAAVDGQRLGEAEIARLAAEVARQMSIARAAGATRVRIIATAVIRDASNAGAVLDEINARCGADVEVLTHEREACLAFLGASRTCVPAPDEPLAVLDIGGGSTELAVGTLAGGVSWWTSLPIGSATVTERWLASDPPSDTELSLARADLEREFAAMSAPPSRLALAVGGSAGSVGRLVGGVLDEAGLARLLVALEGVPSHEVAARHGLDQRRARLLSGGVLLLEQARQALRCPLSVGAGGVREGVIFEELQGVHGAS